MNKKKLILTIGVIIVVFSIISYWDTIKQRKALNMFQTSTQNGINDWQNYKSQKFGYEIKFPKEWGVVNTNEGLDFKMEDKVLVSLTEIKDEDPEGYARAKSVYGPIPMPGQEKAIAPYSFEKIEVNGIRGYYRKGPHENLQVYLPNKNLKLVVIINGTLLNNEELFKKLVATFKFEK